MDDMEAISSDTSKGVKPPIRRHSLEKKHLRPFIFSIKIFLNLNSVSWLHLNTWNQSLPSPKVPMQWKRCSLLQ